MSERVIYKRAGSPYFSARRALDAAVVITNAAGLFLGDFNSSWTNRIRLFGVGYSVLLLWRNLQGVTVVNYVMLHPNNHDVCVGTFNFFWAQEQKNVGHAGIVCQNHAHTARRACCHQRRPMAVADGRWRGDAGPAGACQDW